jgi:hypothetical protein
MNPTLYAARIDGPVDSVLRLHTSHAGAIASLLEEGRRLHEDRFGYVTTGLPLLRLPKLLSRTPRERAEILRRASDALTGAGWHGRVEELPVVLDDDATAARLADAVLS